MTDERTKRNEVFAQPPATNVDLTQHVAIDSLTSLDASIPTELAPLPSNGWLYPRDFPFHGKEMVEITPMTARSEDILTSRAYIKKGTTITEFIKSCLVEKNVNPAMLLVGDRNALMVSIRVTGYGSIYDAEVTCGNDEECGAKNQQKFDLTALEVRRLKLEPLQYGHNEFEFLLPHSKKRVRFRFLTGSDEENIALMNEKNKKLGLSSQDNVVTTNLMNSLLSIDGIEDRNKLSRFIPNMHARDSRALREYIRENEPGLVMKQEVVCPKCDHREVVNIPMGTSFLWPGSR